MCEQICCDAQPSDVVDDPQRKGEPVKNGVRVNAVWAGIIKTLMHSPENHPFFASLHPMGRMGEISEIVRRGVWTIHRSTNL
jgi:NAD(P)-dependent dehydrogenase (short-subunit alcohol dehydrogenase family)